MRTAEGRRGEASNRVSAGVVAWPTWSRTRGSGGLNGRLVGLSPGVLRVRSMDRGKLEAARPITSHCSGPGFAGLSPAADWARWAFNWTQRAAFGMRDGDLYLRMYPQLEKWLNQCLACQRRGYKPELPSQIHPGVAAQHLREYFDELPLNQDGLCHQCAKHLGRRDVDA